tara:strand:- start:209 stop:751 length:543 start_codon:yes stop_codon:yes gene_type:complete
MGIFDKFHPGLGGGALTGGGGYRPRPKPKPSGAKKQKKSSLMDRYKAYKADKTKVGGTGSKKMPTKAEIAKLKSTGKVQTSDPRAVRPGKAIKYKESVNPIAKKAAGPGKTKKYTKPTVSGARTKAQEAMSPTSKKLKKMGSQAHIKPKRAIEKALKATSESGQRAIKAGTKSYKRFMVK